MERPVECGHCKLPVKVVYKEIAGASISISEMCEECPILKQKLHGELSTGSAGGQEKLGAGLYCGNCRTSLESVLTGNPLGCVECYSVFSDPIIARLIAAGKISEAAQKNLAAKKIQPIHVGKSPSQSMTMSSSQLTALNVALNEAIKKENYEQAAWLRDQIKILMEKSDEGKS